MEEHVKAAEAFAAAIERSHDESVQSFPTLPMWLQQWSTTLFLQAKRTLRMLYNEQSKESRELNRRIEKLQEEGKDPSQPQPRMVSNAQPRSATIPPQRTMTSSPRVPSRMESPQPLQRMTDTVDESFMLLGDQRVSKNELFPGFSLFFAWMMLVRARWSIQPVLEHNARNAGYPLLAGGFRNRTLRQS